MSLERNMQAEIIGQLQALLVGVPQFGAAVVEDSVARVLDAEDSDLSDEMIVLQEGDTVELDRTPSNCREQWTVNLVAMSRNRDAPQALRTARLAIKRALKGAKAGLEVPGLVSVEFPASSVRLPEPGRRWSYRVLPITFTYNQPL